MESVVESGKEGLRSTVDRQKVCHAYVVGLNCRAQRQRMVEILWLPLHAASSV